MPRRSQQPAGSRGRSHLSPKDILSTTFSLDAITSSYTTVIASRNAPNEKPENPNGFAPHSIATDKDTLWRFKHDLRIFFARHNQFALSTDTLQDFVQIVQMCEDAGLELTVFISPSHAVQWEAVAKTGSWELFEQWKRELTAITPVWDFSGYSTVTTETVRSGMTYYRDNSHYRPIVGDWVLKRMFGTALTQAEIPEDFGVLLTPDTVDTHLATIRQDRQQWRRKNASVLAWVQDIKESALGTQSATSASLSSVESDLAQPNSQ